VVSDRAGMSGSLAYVNGATFESHAATIASADASSVTVSTTLVAAGGDSRYLSVELHGLRAGATARPQTAEDARACLTIVSAPTQSCFALAGTVDVRALSSSCWEDERGSTVCADDVDLTIHLAASDPGVWFHVDLDLVRVEHWADTQCPVD
jgi:hypothetical protein